MDTGIAIGMLRLRLVYDSTAEAPMGAGGSRAFAAKPLVVGALWASTIHRQVLVQGAGKGALVARGDGRTVSFAGNGAGVFTAEADARDKLLTVAGGYRYIDAAAQAIESYDDAGRLTAIHWAAGASVTLSYSTGAVSGVAPSAGYLVKAQDNQGREIRFTYALPTGADPGSSALLTKVTDAQGEETTLGYDSLGNLSAIAWAGGTSRAFHYENASFPRALTGITNELGVRYATFGYDSEGRAISTQYAGGAASYSASYDTPPQVVVSEVYDSSGPVIYRYHNWSAPQGVSLATPQGASVALGTVQINGKNYLSSRSQPAGSGCAASTSAMTYDANGNLASHDDFSGNRTCYVSDLARNLQTTRVEGLATTVSCSSVLPESASLPAGSRRITTQWHPDWALPVRVSEPGRITHYVYNGQADPTASNALASCSPPGALLPDGKPIAVLCKKVELATLSTGAVDSSVAARTINYQYDIGGRVLSSTDANGRTTQQAYYAASTNSADPDFDKVSILLHGNGPDGSTVFADASSETKNLTLDGTVTIDTTQSQFGGASIKFAKQGHLSGTNAAFAMGTGDFTIEAWVRWTTASGSEQRGAFQVSTNTSGLAPNTANIALLANTGSTWAAYANGVMTTSSVIALNTWYHVAIARSSGTTRLFVNGVQLASKADSFNYAGTGLAVGGYYSAPQYLFDGHVDDFRITKGVARYTSNFTPPAQEHPDAASVPYPGYSPGDLHTITNPAGHVTTYNLYDRAGRVRKMTDAKGVVTDIAYTPRGWVSTMTVTPPGSAARTTTYTYDNAGQLTGTTQPDGTTVSYTYDAAHRLTGATDSRGNSVAYTLDNTGNRTGEEVRDPGGALQRAITRSFDALNRLQQITGAAR